MFKRTSALALLPDQEALPILSVSSRWPIAAVALLSMYEKMAATQSSHLHTLKHLRSSYRLSSSSFLLFSSWLSSEDADLPVSDCRSSKIPFSSLSQSAAVIPSLPLISSLDPVR